MSSHIDETGDHADEPTAGEELKEYSAQDILKMDQRIVERMIFIVKNPEAEKDENNETKDPRYV